MGQEGGFAGMPIKYLKIGFTRIENGVSEARDRGDEGDRRGARERPRPAFGEHSERGEAGIRLEEAFEV